MMSASDSHALCPLPRFVCIDHIGGMAGRLSSEAQCLPKMSQVTPQFCVYARTMVSSNGDVERNLHSEGTSSRGSDLERFKGIASVNPTHQDRVWIGRSQYREERSLNRRIVEAPDAEYVLAIVTEALRKPHWGQPRRLPLSPLNCATALHRIAKRMEADSMLKSERLVFARRRELKEFLGAVVQALPECSAQGLANIGWALSKIGGSSLFIEEMDLLANAALDKLPDFNAQNLANTAGACASMLHAAPILFEGIGEQAGLNAGNFRPQELVQILWAFASLNQPINPLFDALDELAKKPDAQASIFRGFTQQQLASMAWSTAVLKQMRRPWFSVLWRNINTRAVMWGAEMNTSQADRQPKGSQHLSQLYQANLTLRLECADINLATEKEFENVLNEAWENEKAIARSSSVDHKEVSRLLVGTGRKWVSEYCGAVYSVDLALVESKVAIEIDGPTHFTRNTGTYMF